MSIPASKFWFSTSIRRNRKSFMLANLICMVIIILMGLLAYGLLAYAVTGGLIFFDVGAPSQNIMVDTRNLQDNLINLAPSQNIMVDTRNPQDNLLNLAPGQNIEPVGNLDEDARFDPNKTNSLAAYLKRIQSRTEKELAKKREQENPGENLANPYAAYFDRKKAHEQEQLNLALLEASRTDPDDEAAVRELSRKTGIPGYLVGQDKEEIEHELSRNIIGLKDIAKWYPVVARQLSDPEFAKLAWDDTPNLGNTEQLWASLIIFFLFSIPFIIVQYFLTAQRLRDFAVTGWLSLLWVPMGFLPPLWLAFLIVLCAVPGTKGENRFGSDPLQER